MAKPFLKWAGGKRQLLDEIERHLPEEIKSGKIKTYFEPFIGGGAVLFHMMNKGYIKNAVVVDFNKELILVYKTIKRAPKKLISELQNLQKKYDSMEKGQRRELYFQTRENFNRNRPKTKFNSYSLEWVKRASEFIFLNKTGFNGLFRVNKSGEFNVPPSNMGNKDFVQRENILSVNRALKNVKILNGDYQIIEKHLDGNSFVYFDPPYRPLTQTSFTSYSVDDWTGDLAQQRLADFCKALNKDGVKILLSNSDPTQIDENDLFFEEAYPQKEGFQIERILASRAINSKGSGRGKIYEILVKNY